MREELKDLSKDFDCSEEDLKSLQSGVGQIVGEVLRQLTEEKCKYMYIVHCTCKSTFTCILCIYLSTCTVYIYIYIYMYIYVQKCT